MRPFQLTVYSLPGRTPTKSTSEQSVGIAGMPWENNAGEGKYQYHPGGDTSVAPKDAPSAINVVVIPDVNLPKVRKSLCVILETI